LSELHLEFTLLIQIERLLGDLDGSLVNQVD
jgi:hypothetical protein